MIWPFDKCKRIRAFHCIFFNCVYLDIKKSSSLCIYIYFIHKTNLLLFFSKVYELILYYPYISCKLCRCLLSLQGQLCSAPFGLVLEGLFETGFSLGHTSFTALFEPLRFLFPRCFILYGVFLVTGLFPAGLFPTGLFPANFSPLGLFPARSFPRR